MVLLKDIGHPDAILTGDTFEDYHSLEEVGLTTPKLRFEGCTRFTK